MRDVQRYGRRLVRVTLTLALVLTVLADAVPARANWRSLTGLLPVFTNSFFGAGTFSPDGQYLVYTADAEVDDVVYLYSVPVAGGAPIRLNPDLAAGGGVGSYKITADSQSVIYASRPMNRGIESIYRVPIGGGASVQLSGSLGLHGSTGPFELDPTTQRVVYEAFESGTGVPALYSVPIAGGAPVQISAALASGRTIANFGIDPIGGQVIYIADAEVAGRLEMYGVASTGGTPVRLSPVGATVENGFAFDPFLPVVAFKATPSGSSNTHLYLNATAGGALIQLNVALGAGDNVFSYAFTPDGTKVVYGVNTGPAAGGHWRGNLYAVSIGGGVSTPLSVPTDVSYGADVLWFSITPDSQRVVFNYQLVSLIAPELQSVTVDGTDRQTLYTQGASGAIGFIYASPDSQWALFNVGQAQRLYRAPVGGGSAVPLDVLSAPAFTGDGQRLIALDYDTYASGDTSYDLVSVGLGDLSLWNLTRLETGAEIWGWTPVAADGQTLAYLVRQTIGAETRYEIRITDGAAAPYRLHLAVIRK